MLIMEIMIVINCIVLFKVSLGRMMWVFYVQIFSFHVKVMYLLAMDLFPILYGGWANKKTLKIEVALT